jgi:hypothetical protein
MLDSALCWVNTHHQKRVLKPQLLSAAASQLLRPTTELGLLLPDNAGTQMAANALDERPTPCKGPTFAVVGTLATTHTAQQPQAARRT